MWEVDPASRVPLRKQQARDQKATENEERIDDQETAARPADIAVEVVSPESARRDRVDKLAEYEQAKVPEYWIVDHEQRRTAFRVLGDDGRYRLVLEGETGEYRSTVLPELRLRAEWLWQDRPGSDLGEILRTLNVPIP